jgi:hypothetical protein
LARDYVNHLRFSTVWKALTLAAPQYVASFGVGLDLHGSCSFPGIFLAR